MRAIFAEAGRGPAYAPWREHRKQWEVAQAARTLHDFHALEKAADVLGVAAGIEETTFWATNFARGVFAGQISTLTPEPGRPMCRPRCSPIRVATRPVTGTRADSSSSTWTRASCATRMPPSPVSFARVRSSTSAGWTTWRVRSPSHRVLKPGGVASLSTEYRLRGPGPGIPGTLLFDAAELDELICSPTPGTSCSRSSWRSPSRRWRPNRNRASAVAGRSRSPHVVLHEGEFAWTSVHLALRKQS